MELGCREKEREFQDLLWGRRGQACGPLWGRGRAIGCLGSPADACAETVFCSMCVWGWVRVRGCVRACAGLPQVHSRNLGEGEKRSLLILSHSSECLNWLFLPFSSFLRLVKLIHWLFLLKYSVGFSKPEAVSLFKVRPYFDFLKFEGNYQWDGCVKMVWERKGFNGDVHLFIPGKWMPEQFTHGSLCLQPSMWEGLDGPGLPS